MFSSLANTTLRYFASWEVGNENSKHHIRPEEILSNTIRAAGCVKPTVTLFQSSAWALELATGHVLLLFLDGKPQNYR